MENLIKKLNNIERNVGWVERHYWLGLKRWYVGPTKLFVGQRPASEKEIEVFLKLKKDFEAGE